MSDTTESELEQHGDMPEREEGGFGVRSPFSHDLHPTAQKILAAAKNILRERGYQGMTLQAISAEAHVNKAGVWYYFGGKQRLVHALLEDVVIRESRHFGDEAPVGATIPERVDLLIGSAAQVGERLQRFAAFYELLPEASRDEELHEHLMAMYQAWYDWADEILSPAIADSEASDRRSAGLGQFASLLLDGIFLQMIVAAPGFDLEAALGHARRSLSHLTTMDAEGPTEPALLS
jgi:AcrR family transcriptional regulator